MNNKEIAKSIIQKNSGYHTEGYRARNLKIQRDIELALAHKDDNLNMLEAKLQDMESLNYDLLQQIKLA